ncbi:MAG: hypothetical protein A2126_01330 [Candidatus Woykebacteria bacterium GWB1_45_5]|uniref:Uncharacterized protein n=1 Tax=Candidatus Woykebacteria bacterium GWB1_45_5 TaxID=1802592 RepID=A0A1G1W5X2_9BACT|nr:MAG: hypothetical protein A2126_01330 [Candidatus Woykebacteria bacterium GWB1_45_5]
MKLLYALLCDSAFLSIDRKVNIIGVFETINAAKFPVTHPKFVIVGSVAPSKKNFKMSINIVDEENKVPVLGDIQEREVSLPKEGGGQNFNFIVEVVNANFAKPGSYSVKISIDSEVIGEIPLKVAESKLEALGPPS